VSGVYKAEPYRLRGPLEGYPRLLQATCILCLKKYSALQAVGLLVPSGITSKHKLTTAALEKLTMHSIDYETLNR